MTPTLTAEDLDTIEAEALAATKGLRDDGYRLVATDGEIVCEYKHSAHPNAQQDGALFARAREYALGLVAALRARDAELIALRARVEKAERELAASRAALRKYGPKCGECGVLATRDEPKYALPQDRLRCDVCECDLPMPTMEHAAALRAAEGTL